KRLVVINDQRAHSHTTLRLRPGPTPRSMSRSSRGLTRQAFSLNQTFVQRGLGRIPGGVERTVAWLHNYRARFLELECLVAPVCWVGGAALRGDQQSWLSRPVSTS